MQRSGQVFNLQLKQLVMSFLPEWWEKIVSFNNLSRPILMRDKIKRTKMRLVVKYELQTGL
jgi:hypothetical protein